MPDFTIDAVTDMESFSTEHGEFISYTVEFTGEQGSGSAQHNRKAASPPPKPGDVIDGELVQKGGKTTLKRVWQENKPGASSPQMSPEKDRKITRMHSQHMAVLWLATLQKQGIEANDAALEHWLDFFDADAEGR